MLNFERRIMITYRNSSPFHLKSSASKFQSQFYIAAAGHMLGVINYVFKQYVVNGK